MMFSVADLNFERNFYLALSLKFALVNCSKLQLLRNHSYLHRNMFVRTYETYIMTNIQMVCVFMCQLIQEFVIVTLFG